MKDIQAGDSSHEFGSVMHVAVVGYLDLRGQEQSTKLPVEHVYSEASPSHGYDEN